MGEQSTRMFVVLKGTVAVGTAEGLTLMTEEAITTIGERARSRANTDP